MNERVRGQLLPTRAIAKVWWLTLAVGTLTVVAWLGGALGRQLAAPFALPWFLLAMAWVVAEVIPVRFTFHRQGHTVNLAEVPLLVGLVFCSPAGVLGSKILASALVAAVYHRQPVYKLMLNVGSDALSTVLAVRLYYWALAGASPISRRGWLAALLAVAAMNVVSHLCILTAITLADRFPDRADLRALQLTTALVTIVNSCLGLVTICVLWIDSLGGVFLAALTVVLGLGYRAHQRLRVRQSVLERIHDFTQAVDGHLDVQSLVGATLGACRDTMGVDGAELVIRQGAGWTRYRVDDDGLHADSAPAPAPLERAAIDDAKAILVPRSRRPAEATRLGLGARGIVDAIAVTLPGADLEAVLTVTNRQDPKEGFGPVDVRAFTSMASHTAVALQSALLLDRLHREVEEKEYQALHDALTGLPNRTMFAARVEEFLADPSVGSAAVMLLDLDAFKEVNDTLGHKVGDTVLKSTALRLLGEVRNRGTVARLGGDEFAIIVPAADEVAAVQAAEAVKRAIEQPIEEDALLIEVRASVGVALTSVHGSDVATLLRLADVAMYAAKESHAGVTLYETRHDHYSPRRLTLAGELRQAMAARQLTIAYQPQLDLETNRVDTVEALVRWSHPRHGMIPPDEFIPVAEQTGLIVPLTDYVLTESLVQQARWARRGYDLVVAVNLSPRVVGDGNLPRLVAQRLAATGVKPDRLTLELTETGLVTDPARVASVLHRLAEMGVRTSIDDFGTGYSSLSRLSDLPVAEVKIDKSFVFAMAGGSGETLVRSIVDLGHNLNLRVVAEGVEDPVTIERLRQLRCNAVQGFHLSRALPAPAFEAWLEERGDVAVATSAIILPLRKARSAPGL